MKQLIKEIEDLIAEHYIEEFKTYKFKSSDEEEGTWILVENLIEDMGAILNAGDFQIECELNEIAEHIPDKDIIELDKYRI